ncbi:MAG: hypothetical protein WBK91_08820 [Alphaproteobacteria bacterium]
MRRATRILHKPHERLEPPHAVTGECTLWPKEIKHGHHVIGLEAWELCDHPRVPGRDF